ncbi:oxysterol-binding protein-related protein 2 [Aplysia californica]|uniref:Oxysterol-binding protein n=1 Tax=Aplysia californica TaxID=6500 RepID=A0ABM1A560_APLCA|nr:oxysterol-binding protein-related protein 2 [Aplysia californica]
MQDSLKNAQAHRGSLEDQVQTLRESITSISEHLSQGKAAGSSANGRGSGGGGAQVTAADLQVLEAQAADILRSSQDMCSALTHCMTLLVQQEELRQIQLREEQERCRVLQDSLHALATEHHELERSISRRPSFVSMDEEFFDCDDEEVFGSPTSDQFTDACSRDLVMEGADNSRASSRASCSNCGRTSLPVPMFSRSDFSFWSILKQCIGKELSKITMPVVFNEPLSFIQRLAEYMEYAPLLDKAVKCDDPVERLEYISAFAISALSSNWERIGKPFNPLLGETYEIDRPDLGFRFVGEQVSHHPPITAFHAEGNGYAFHGSIQPKLKFWGKTVEIFPKGVMTLELFKQKETYTWQNVNFNIHNIIVGQLWVEHCGTMEITNNKTSYKSVLNFKQCGWFSKELHHVEGFVYNGKKKERAMYGSWVLGMYSCPADAYESFLSNPDNKGRISTKDKSEHKTALLTYNYEIPDQKTLWRVNPRPPHSADYYHFSIFAMGLNEILPGMKSSLPRTDSRLRPDIRSMEDGKIDYSADEKNRLEEKQRDARKDRKKKNKEWTPVWFTASKNATSGKEEWSVSNNYWQRNWAACPDIF